VIGRILLVDDEEIVIRSCQRILREGDYEIEVARDGLAALEKINEGDFDVLILDIMMPRMDGLEVLRRVKESRPEIDIIMITGLHDIETAVKAMKFGALDYLPKPFEPEELQLLVAKAFDRRAKLHGTPGPEDPSSASYHFENIIGSSLPMQRIFRLIAQCAPTNSTVMLRGESGTGKELIARAIHYNSLRVRACQGLFHRCCFEQERPVRNSRWRHLVPRRDWQHHAVHSGKIAAFHRGTRVQGSR
jgi:DNA-binding NtrC family response regulator